ncbi:DUF445 domain-containing protein [uncultured Clostridium sp.]|uniref:DUF445 domain-containing protein n=1 Tax=uncultured Clostridium sp. TaxID=59620 RepID=UPI0028E4BD18|nr:DUF445 domain-containing protein [uncultured Clostridium sp.]
MKIKTNQKASISLVIMFAGFLLTLFSDNIIIMMILRSGFEAGLVGGIADWFAVTALFRYPFGIQIPHTALLPKNRQKITTALVSIVENNLLNKASIINKVQELNVVRRVLNICKNNMYSNEVKSRINYIIKSTIDYISIDKLSLYLLDLIGSYLNKLDSRKLLETGVKIFLQNNYEEKVLDALIKKCTELVQKEEIKKEAGDIVFSTVKKLGSSKIKQYMLNTVIDIVGKDKIGSIVQNLIISALNDLKKSDSLNRKMILELMENNIKSIRSDEIIIQKIDEFKSSMPDNVQLKDFILESLNGLKSRILIYINDDNYIEKIMLPSIDKAIEKVLSNVELIDKLEEYIQGQTSEYINNNHEKIGKLVKENIEKIDTKTLIELIEYKVGDDLQWIRVNGAICGFFIGLILGIIRVVFR